jgi:uncharacterized surface protein with fasciclin (FAS1) repeats
MGQFCNTTGTASSNTTTTTTNNNNNNDECNTTLLIPINDAFVKFNQTKFFDRLTTPNWSVHLQNFLLFHTIKPYYEYTVQQWRGWSTEDFVDGQALTMRNRETVTIHVLKRGISITTARERQVSNMINAETIASNGIVHTLDAVLEPWFFDVDLFALGRNYKNYQLLTEFAIQVGLVGILRQEFTLLAPTDAAFTALGDTVLDALRNDTKLVRKVLLNHIIHGVNPSMHLTDGLVLTAIGGRDITFAIINNNYDNSTQKPPLIQINGNVPVIASDLLARNGLAHVIDQVLFHPDSFKS